MFEQFDINIRFFIKNSL